MVLLSGCAANDRVIEPQPAKIHEVALKDPQARIDEIRADPVAYLQEVARNCSQLHQYTVEFTRFERRGLFRIMYGPEYIVCRFRHEPYSLHMKWLNEDIKYNESAYIAGEHDDKVRFITRWWSPPLSPPPTINEVALMTPVIWGEAKRPLNQWGVEQMVTRTLTSIAAAGDNVKLTYQNVLKLPQTETTVYHLHLEYSGSKYKVPIQELYINIDNDLPAGTVLKFASGQIDAAYYYKNLDASVELTDDDFLLSVERENVEDVPADD
ncbi:MAG: DUF1571 domain-containing protein [Planctomycetota bacterium]